MYVIFEDDAYTYCNTVNNRDEAVDRIMEEYFKYESSMYDILATTQLEGFSIEDNLYIYARCMYQSDGDTIVHFRDEKWCVLSDDYEILGR